VRGHHADAQPLQSGPHAGAVANADRPFVPRPLRAPLDRLPRRPRGRRTLTITANRRGRYTYARYAPGDYRDIALDATLRQAAPAQHRRNARARMDIRPQDLHRKVRTRKAANLIVFAVDASWSMAAAARMQATKGAILSLLMDAYQKRDQVALVSFQRNTARLVLPLTSSVERAQRALKHLPVGGKTPLSAGLLLAHEVIRRAQRRQREVMPLLILLTDGAGNVALSERPPQEEALLLAHAIASDHIRSVVVNTEHVALDRGLSQQLATALNAPCYTLEALRAESLYKTVRNELESKPQ
jgi:magnesium chelatase subunit D